MKPLITMVVPYYRQPNMLRKQLETWASYSPEVLAAFVFNVIDDGSPEPALTEVMNAVRPIEARGGMLQLHRIKEDVPWNRGCARNLGTQVCTTPWVLHVDTDHVLPPRSAELLLRAFTGTMKPSRWFRFDRYRVGAADETRKKDKADPKAAFVKIHPHIDSYLCTPEAYWKAGGYNTRFSGVLGGGTPFLKEMVKVHGEPAVLPLSLEVHTRHSVPDASITGLPRDSEAFKRRKQEIMKKYGTLRADPREAVPSPWERVL